MKTLNNVTLIIIDNYNIDAAKLAVKKSTEKLKFADVVFIQKPEIKTVEDYSEFCIKELYKYFNTSHCLIIQHDGYVSNPDLWNNDWLKYDYIGAPWHYDLNNVGNGGFSLRSRKLMEFCSTLIYTELHPEDDVICRQYRFTLEMFGFKFAPEKVAAKFSFEPNPKNKSIQKHKTFGFHGIKVK